MPPTASIVERLLEVIGQPARADQTWDKSPACLGLGPRAFGQANNKEHLTDYLSALNFHRGLHYKIPIGIFVL